jgi:carboxyl-terminal processing protease
MSPVTKIGAAILLFVILLSPGVSAASSGSSLENRLPFQQKRKSQQRKDAARARREKAFRLVWETVKNEHFDPTFGGVDWEAVRLRYAPRVKDVRSDQELHSLLQAMLNELRQSHFAILTPDQIPRIKPKRARPEKGSEAENGASDLLMGEAENEGDNELATRMTNGIGVDVRILDGQVVITRVAPASPAERAGVRPGFILKSVDDLSLEDMLKFVSEKTLTPTIHMLLRRRILVDYLGGEQGTEVRLGFLDEQGRERPLAIKRERLTGTLTSSFGNLPPLYTEFETKRLPNDIGYLRFDIFTPQVAEKICGAIKAMRGASALIIDLRGNPGGVMGAASGIAGLLINKTGLVGVLRTRKGQLPIPAFPQRSVFQGPVVVLIDRLSGSTAEVLAAALQESGRAAIVGERSAGVVLGADVIKLPTGALFQYARTGFITSQGVTLEGKGVSPDVEKRLDRVSLLKGQDNQLQEAIGQIELRRESAQVNSTSAQPSSPPKPLIADVKPNPPTLAQGNRPSDAAKPETPAPLQTFKSTPQADEIMERYIREVGGREALKRLKSRVSIGKCILPLQGLNGKVLIKEEAPNKMSMEIDIPDLGVMKTVYDGSRGWMQHPLFGFHEFEDHLLPSLKRYYDFYKAIRYRELFTGMAYVGMKETPQGKVNVIELMTPEGYPEEMHFDVGSGLLVYGGGAYLSDYRQIGEVKVPFMIRIPVAGLDLVMQLEQVTHNAAINDEAFAEPTSCFTAKEP